MRYGKRHLAALVYETGESQTIDRLLDNLANELQCEGYALAGTVQRSVERTDRYACDVIVRDLSSHFEVKISEDRGPNARGCRLDTCALEALVGSTVTALDNRVQAMVINRFGKQEARGTGFRDVIGLSILRGIPTVVGVNVNYLDCWRAFAGGYADELVLDDNDIRDWMMRRLPLVSTDRKPGAGRIGSTKTTETPLRGGLSFNYDTR